MCEVMVGAVVDDEGPCEGVRAVRGGELLSGVSPPVVDPSSMAAMEMSGTRAVLLLLLLLPPGIGQRCSCRDTHRAVSRTHTHTLTGTGETRTGVRALAHTANARQNLTGEFGADL